MREGVKGQRSMSAKVKGQRSMSASVLKHLVYYCYDGKELKWPLAGNRSGDTLVRWLAYADDICILADSKAELSAILNILNDVLAKFGMTLSAEKSFWMTLGCYVDE